MLLTIAQLQARDERSRSLPMHLDSPMAERSTGCSAISRRAQADSARSPATPFGVRNFTLHVTTEESKELNALTGSA